MYRKKKRQSVAEGKPLMVTITSIPHKDQRYLTVGDWYTTKFGVTNIRVSKLSSWRSEFLVAVHELIEYVLCRHAGITQQQVDRFDKKHEKEQVEVELGDLKRAPYRRQHCVATGIERILAAELDVPWDEYERELIKLME
jgi:hypothetical protein